jgi:hypothetical protein
MPTILATLEEIGRIVVQGQPKQKMLKTPSQPIKTGYGGIYLSSQLYGKYIEGSSQANLGINVKPYSKNNYSKKD